MDALSQLLALANLRGVVEGRLQSDEAFAHRTPATSRTCQPFVLMLRGNARLAPDGASTTDLVSSTLAVVLGGAAHVLSSPVQTERGLGVELLHGHFEATEGAAQLLAAQAADVLCTDLSTGDETARALPRMLSTAVALPGPGSGVIVDALLRIGYALALRTNGAHPGSLNGSLMAAAMDPKLSKALTAILANPGLPWTVDELSAQASMSRSAFTRHFEQRTGQTPHTALTWLRMEAARRLLGETFLQLDEIAARVGFRSGSSFARAFRAHNGTSPLGWRKSVRS